MLLEGRFLGCVEEGNKEDGGEESKEGVVFGYSRAFFSSDSLEIDDCIGLALLDEHSQA